MGLEDYSTDALLAEIQRRKRDFKKGYYKPPVTYAEKEGIVISHNNKSLSIRRYLVKLIDTGEKHEFYIKTNVFRKDTAPKQGDIVKLKHILTKADLGNFNYEKARIVEVIKSKQ